MRNKYLPILALVAILTYIHLFALGTLPLYQDEVVYLKRVQMHEWNYFETYKLFRFLGIALNYAIYYICSSSPFVLSALLTVLVFLIFMIYMHLFEVHFSRKDSQAHTIFFLIFLSFPFSLHLLQLRVYAQIVALGIIGVCLWLIPRLLNGIFPIFYLILIAGLYFISLLVYEITLLMPIYFVTLMLCLRNKDHSRSKPILMLAGATFLVMLFYVIGQYVNIESQPKLAVSKNMNYFHLTFFEQFLRKMLYFAYHVKWSFFYSKLYYFSSLSVQAFIVTIIFCLVVGATLWRGLSNNATYLIRKNSVKAIINGFVIIGCCLGLWSYYWIFRKFFALPYYYNYFIIAIGAAFIIVGILSYYSKILLQVKAVRFSVALFLFLAIMTNALLFLSYRLALNNSLKDAERYSYLINAEFGNQAEKYKSILLLGLPPETEFARKLAALNSSVVASLKILNPKWTMIQISASHAYPQGKNKYLLQPGNMIFDYDDILILQYDKKNNIFMKSEGGVADIEDFRDPCIVSVLNYQLAYSPSYNNVILVKKTS